MSLTRRLFLGSTVALGAGSARAATVTQPAPLSPRETALWHMRELERSVREDGASSVMISIAGFRYAGAGTRTVIYQSNQELWDEQGMFTKGGAL